MCGYSEEHNTHISFIEGPNFKPHTSHEVTCYDAKEIGQAGIHYVHIIMF